MFTTRRQPHLLIVDDYADALDIWEMYLTSKGYRVTTAKDGASALREARAIIPDLIVLDLELPGISGIDVARELRRDPRTEDIPLIAATGFSQDRLLRLARQVGFDTIVVKPCDPDQMVDEIDRLLPDGDTPELGSRLEQRTA
jgi:two-component system cell cycle response regulator DivK